MSANVFAGTNISLSFGTNGEVTINVVFTTALTNLHGIINTGGFTNNGPVYFNQIVQACAVLNNPQGFLTNEPSTTIYTAAFNPFKDWTNSITSVSTNGTRISFTGAAATNLNFGAGITGYVASGSINLGVNQDSIFNTITNPITSGKFWTNTTGNRVQLTINYSENDSASSGNPSLNMTNISNGQWFNATNGFLANLTNKITGQAIFLMSTNEYFIATNMSSGTASATIDASWAIKM